ncbi:MAG: SGNH/GDSL hydrolase family protein [Acidimicrobiales bacterium]|nr:SGNH/GDSL hydrolase family protein [Acidimicrobiales bacterium]
MVILLATVLAAPVALVVGEAILATRGAAVDTPDVATLSSVITPESPRGEVRALWLGDSTAAAVGTSDADGAVSSVVGKALSAQCQVSVATSVVAVSGARIDDVLREQVPLVAGRKADIVFISAGANDTIHLTSPARFSRVYAEVIEALVAAGVSSDHIVLIGVPDMGSPPRLAQPLRALMGWRGRRLDARVQALAREKGARYVDLFAGTSKPIRSDPPRYFAADDYHPNDNGYALWGKTITPVAAPICK